MGFRVQIVDSSDRPKKNYEVIVVWQGGGTSRGRTDSMGIYDTNVGGGQVSEIRCEGRKLYSSCRVSGGDTLKLQY